MTQFFKYKTAAGVLAGVSLFPYIHDPIMARGVRIPPLGTLFETQGA